MANPENYQDYEDEIIDDEAVIEAKDEEDDEDEKSKKMKSKSKEDDEDEDDGEDEDKEMKEAKDADDRPEFVKHPRMAGQDKSKREKVGYSRSFRQPGQASKSDLSKLAASATAQFLGKGGKMRKEETEIDEATMAAETLHPGARKVSDDKAITSSKISMMQHMMGTMNSMNKGDLVDFFNKTMSQFGPNKDWGVGNKSGENQSSIDTTLGKGPKTKDPMPKLHVKEDIEEMFNGYDLTEDFKDNVSTLFEAAINARLIAEQARLEEEYETQINEEIAIFKEEMTSKLDTYLDYVVEQWMKENEVAVESTLRNELAEEFIDGLKNLFAEHYIAVPEDKVDVLEAMAEKVASLEAKLDESISYNAELQDMVLEASRQDVFEELASDLALTQQEKFLALAEGIEFDGDLETYAHKLTVIKENYFTAEAPTHSSNIEEETFEGVISEETRNIDPTVGRYVQAIARTIKK